jgi:hypothetical protein
MNLKNLISATIKTPFTVAADVLTFGKGLVDGEGTFTGNMMREEKGKSDLGNALEYAERVKKLSQ